MEIQHKGGTGQFKSYCTHCGNVTIKILLRSELGQGVDEEKKYHFCKCTICDGIVLQRVYEEPPSAIGYYHDVGDEYVQHVDENDIEQLWPPALSLPSEAPDRVRAIYEEARSVKRQSPSSFAVQIGRALEAVTGDRKAQGRSLHHRVNWLIDNDELPPVFGEMAHINRILRNWGAHDTETDIEPEDVEIIDEFFRAIIEYIYVAKAKVNKVEALLDQRQSDA